LRYYVSVGHINPLLAANQSLATETPSANYGVDPGGQWSPSDCVARQRLAVIVPFRDREAHLQLFLRVMHPMLQRQMVEYTIFVVEQVGFGIVRHVLADLPPSAHARTAGERESTRAGGH
jgi:hypothetical protein